MKKLIQLIAGFLFMAGFLSLAGPVLRLFQPYEEMEGFIRSHDIDAGALFYTESPEAVNAGFYLQQSEVAKRTQDAEDQSANSDCIQAWSSSEKAGGGGASR